nr:sigma factor-like helix-turn-helix DNA-binding protein [Pseudoflavonifractor phocaeensis]
MRELTPRQLEILRLNIVFGIPTRDIAKQMGCTTRNITKQRQKSLEKIRFLVTGQGKMEDL